jgi:hypothetical protein
MMQLCAAMRSELEASEAERQVAYSESRDGWHGCWRTVERAARAEVVRASECWGAAIGVGARRSEREGRHCARAGFARQGRGS